MRLTWCAKTAALLVLICLGSVVQAESGSARAIITWDGEGRVFQVGPTTVRFLGAFEGIIYIETSDGALDEGFVRCPAIQELDMEKGTTTAEGHCMITASGGDTAYARWSCSGKPGQCKGKFDLTGGTGEFKGAKGSSVLKVRSPLRALSANVASGSVLRVSSGLAELPELKYELPNSK